MAVIPKRPEAEDGAVLTSELRRMLKERQVLGSSRFLAPHFFGMGKAGRFPASTFTSPNRRVWFEDEIMAWRNAVDEFNLNRGRGKGRRPRA